MFRSLKLYTVHSHKTSAPMTSPVFVREGFNFFAFLFTFIWALYQRCFYFAALIVGANLVLMLALNYEVLNEAQMAISQFLVQLVVGFTANDMLRARFEKTGFIFQDITSGESLMNAQQRYFDRVIGQCA